MTDPLTAWLTCCGPFLTIFVSAAVASLVEDQQNSETIRRRIAEIRRLHREGWTPLKISRQMFFRGTPMRVKTIERIVNDQASVKAAE